MHCIFTHKSNPRITATEIVEQVGIALHTVRREIKRLNDGGYIERIGSEKTGSWKVLRD
ncbi:MAG: winged helix-turn-helix transcriptional regulator [Christensenellaceae bacterium]|nr:winged helix-turn-helix transcriptional regulator [Christensenellaceae bacterium]